MIKYIYFWSALFQLKVVVRNQIRQNIKTVLKENIAGVVSRE